MSFDDFFAIAWMLIMGSIAVGLGIKNRNWFGLGLGIILVVLGIAECIHPF